MALQHLRSSTAHKRPIPAVMSAGQIAVNTNQGSPGLFFKDSNGDLVKVGPVHIGTSAPNSSPNSLAATALVTGTTYQILTVGNSDFTLVGASANTVGTVFTATGTTTGTGTVSGQQGNEKGEQWLDTTGGSYVFKVYDGTAWRSESGTFVDSAGDTMTGALGVIAGTASAPGIFFSGDTNTGLLSPGADSVAITTGGTQRVVVNSSGKVGIGDTSPSEKLNVAGNIMLEGSDQYLYLTNAGTSNSGIYVRGRTSDSELRSHSTGIFTWEVTGNEKMRIDSSGNVGIGTSSPGAKLVVNEGTLGQTAGSSLTIASFRNSVGNNNLLNIKANRQQDGIDWNNTSIRLQRTIDSDAMGYIEFTSNRGGGDAQDIAFGRDNTENVRFTQNGSVGIGTTSPAHKLTVSEDSSSANAELAIDYTGGGANRTAMMRFKRGGTNFAYIAGATAMLTSGNKDDLGIAPVSGKNLLFGIGNSEKARIDSSGNVGIGTSSPSAMLDVNGSITTAGTIKSEDKLVIEVAGGGGDPWIICNDETTTKFSVNRQGTLRIGGDSDIAKTDFNIKLDTDGSATFAGNVQVGNDPDASAQYGVEIETVGRIDVRRSDAGDITFASYSNTGTSPTAFIRGNGSANFAGGKTEIRSAGNIVVYRQASASADVLQQWKSDNGSTESEQIQFFATGSASFAGPVNAVGVVSDRTGVGETAFSARLNGTQKVDIKAEGGAEFAGGDFEIFKQGSFSAYRNSANGGTSSASVFNLYSDVYSQKGEILKIACNGSAEFAGTVEVNGINNLKGITCREPSDNTAPQYALVNCLNKASSTVAQIFQDGSATFSGTVTANGTVLTSDARFKENITPANPQLADIEALGAQLKNFDWNADAPGSNDTRQLGLIAQDVEAVCPGIVKTIARTKQGAELTPEVVVPAVYETRTVPAVYETQTVPAVLGDDGEIIEDETTKQVLITEETTEEVLVTEEQITPATYEELDDSYKGISHDALIMKLLGAVAELSAKVAALEAG